MTGPFFPFRLGLTHLHNSFHSFIFPSILLDILLFLSPHLHSPPHILLHSVIVPSRLVHPMSSSIVSSSDRIIYTQKAHTGTSRILMPFLLTINLILAPTLTFVYFLVVSSLVYTLVPSHLFRNHFSTISCLTPLFCQQQLSLTHFCHTPFQA